MRITQNQMAHTLVDNLNRISARVNRAQIDLATGVRLHRPSDDPSGTAKAMALQHRMDEIDLYQASMVDAAEWLKASDAAMTQLTSILHRAADLAVSGANSDKPPEAMHALAVEAEQLLEQAVNVLNTQHNGRYIFSGTAYTKKPFTYNPTGSPQFTWNGNTDPLYRIIEKGQRFAVNVTGNEFSPGDPTGVDFLERLQALVDDLHASKHASLGTDRIGELRGMLSRVTSLQSEVGAKLNRVEQNSARMMDLAIDLESLLASVQDTDIPKTLIDLRVAEAAHETALAIGARIIPRTLLDFLR